MLDTDIGPTADRYTTNSWPMYHRELIDTPPRYDRLSTDIAVDVSADSWSQYRPIIGLLSNDISVEYLPTLDIWTAISVASTYS